ncbi:MAG: TatD family hydrolase, partial [Candidatus Omnitrophica bacterium]|nr:TatD family hydrolase [Candidatus Omnitrophota bacterium]
MRTIIDTHTHLDELPDIDRVLADCVQVGISDIVALGTSLASNRKHLELRHLSAPVSPRIHLAFGLHPGNITPGEIEKCFPFFREHIKEAIAIGETGLDYHYKSVSGNEDKKREQRDVFERHLGLAKESALPVVVHSRGAYRDSLSMTCSAGVTKANFHWYAGPLDVLKDILDAGFLVSVSPSLEYSPEARTVA